MVWPFTASQHQKNVAFKRRQREERIEALPAYRAPLTPEEETLLAQNIEPVVRQVQAGTLKPAAVLKAYGKAALQSQEKTNCLTEIMLRDAEQWAANANLKGPLAGFPVSLKDPFHVKGYDATAGYSALVDKPVPEDGVLVRILRDAGAVPYVKTTIPFTLMTFDGENDLFGRGVNPWNPEFGPGGSSQGEGALIASGGSRVGIGSDVGGSVRNPAAWSGLYSLRFSSFRFPLHGDTYNDGGFEGVPVVNSPMAASLEDLKYFSNAIMEMEPWNYDYALVHQRWRRDAALPAKPRVGVLRFDKYLPATPAVERALATTVNALKKHGCDVVDFTLPEDPSVYDQTVMKLYHADGLDSLCSQMLWGETNDPSVRSTRNYLWWPKPLRRVWEFVLSVLGFKEKAQQLCDLSPQSALEYIDLVSKRQVLRRGVFEKWKAEKLDFVVSGVHPSPALPSAAPHSLYTALYTSLWNLLDQPAGVVPMGRVDKATDVLPVGFSYKKMSYAARLCFSNYDAERMHGLPLAVQITTLRFQDEEALAAMSVVEDALHSAGVYYK